MIDLRVAELPSCLEWEGGSAVIDTSFRTWIEFDRHVHEDDMAWTGIFPEGFPPVDEGWVEAAVEFWKAESATPRPTRQRSNAKLIDLIQDGDHIVASFQQAYGIDLTSEDMHWHRFKALLNGLPDSTKMSKVMGYRDYDERESKRKTEDVMRELRATWSLPLSEEDEDDEWIGALLSTIGR